MLVRATQRTMYNGNWKFKGDEFEVGADITARGYLEKGVVVPVEVAEVAAAEPAASVAPEPAPSAVKRTRLDLDPNASQPRRRYNRRDLQAKE